MARRPQIIGQATDYAGVEWDVREHRPTTHGFDVFIGWPHGELRGKGGRGVAVIITVELAQYLLDTRPRDVVLPVGKTTIKRMRNELGLSWSWDDWWAARAEDLQSMTLQEFSSKHGCSIVAQAVEQVKAATDTTGSLPEQIDLVRYRSDADLWSYQPEFRPLPTTTHGMLLARLMGEIEPLKVPVRIVYMQPEEYVQWLGGRDDSAELRAQWASEQTL